MANNISEKVKDYYGRILHNNRDLKTDACCSVDAPPEFVKDILTEIDDEIMNLMNKRMQLSDSIGHYKKRNNIAVLQPDRWNEILERAIAKGQAKDLSARFVEAFLKAIPSLA